MKGVGFVSEYDGIPKLSTMDWSGRVHPGVLTRVGGSASVKDPEPPTLVKTPGWTRPLQSIVDNFGIPSYSETNPTPFMILTFPLIYGDRKSVDERQCV